MFMDDLPRHSSPDFRLEGSGRRSNRQARARLILTMIAVGVVYLAMMTRLAFLGFADQPEKIAQSLKDITTSATRPDIRDRHGETLATDIVTSSLFAEPRRIIDVDDAVTKLLGALPELDPKRLHRLLSNDSAFVWLKREITPAKENEIHNLGIPGLGFRTEKRRFYPKGETASHIIGHVNVDNVGTAGLEKYIDDRSLRRLRDLGIAGDKELEPVHLSIDLRVQHFVRDELAKAMQRYKAIAAGAVILDVHTGEVIALASLPDYDPNRPSDALKPDRLNRVTAGLYEMGSTFKTFTTAMALDSGLVSMSDEFDARQPLRIGGHTIEDFHAQKRILSVPEVFIYSSNIGTAKMADVVGIKGHQAFLHRVGLLKRIPFELPEIAVPVEPERWRKIHSVTISYGHGAQTTPLQTAVAGAALVNGGKLIPPTLFPRSKRHATEESTQVISAETSEKMQYLLRLNVEKGSGKRAEVKGFRVGGKTGTAEKVVRGRYSSDHRFNAFLAAFPIDDPQYVVLTFIDEPQPEDGMKSATSVTITSSASRAAISPIIGLLPGSRSPPQPNTTTSFPVVNGLKEVSTFSNASGLCA